MALTKGKPKKGRKFLPVMRSIWDNEIYVIVKGKRKDLPNYEAARKMAENQGLDGIRIQYLK